jgi:hypothetical protein
MTDFIVYIKEVGLKGELIKECSIMVSILIFKIKRRSSILLALGLERRDLWSSAPEVTEWAHWLVALGFDLP